MLTFELLKNANDVGAIRLRIDVGQEGLSSNDAVFSDGRRSRRRPAILLMAEAVRLIDAARVSADVLSEG